MGQYGIRLNDEEEKTVLSAMAASGDEFVSSHIKRVYFEALKGDHDVRGQIATTLQRIETMLTDRRKTRGEADGEMMTLLLAANYLLARSMVPVNVRIEMDKHISVSNLENFVKEGKKL
jgi:hypothetical protein